jgi:hypothetical protein
MMMVGTHSTYLFRDGEIDNNHTQLTLDTTPRSLQIDHDLHSGVVQIKYQSYCYHHARLGSFSSCAGEKGRSGGL